MVPPAGQLVRLRRHPEDTPPYFGTFDAEAGRAVTSVGRGYELVTPWECLTHWAVLCGALGQWPEPVRAGSAWNDPFWSPPTDGQRVWVRRFNKESAAVSARWVYAEAGYLIAGTAWVLPWHLVWKWKGR